MVNFDKYSTARSKIIEELRSSQSRSEEAGATRMWAVQSARHPLLGPCEESLFLDLFSNVDTTSVDSAILVLSGTHGVEAPGGAYVQSRLIETDFALSLPPTVALLLCVGVNPYGWAWGRRVDHENCDVNRASCGQFTTRVDYASVRELVEPKRWDDAARTRLVNLGNDLAQLRTLQSAVSGGQYDFPQGLFYGGHAPCWSAIHLRKLLERFERQYSTIKKLAVLDLHSGLGKFAEGSILSSSLERGGELGVRIRAWFGNSVQFTQIGQSVSSPVTGNLLQAIIEWFPSSMVIPVALEMGGHYSVRESLPVLIAENWIHHHPRELEAEEEETIQKAMRDVFYPEQERDFWLGSFFGQAKQILNCMVRGISGGVH